jgi:hypothetical protein
MPSYEQLRVTKRVAFCHLLLTNDWMAPQVESGFEA